VRRPSRSTRPRSTLMVLAAAVSMALLASGVAVADTVSTNFEPNSSPPFFMPGTVNGQDGWKSAVPGNIPSLPNGYDQEVVANTPPAPPAFENQSLRISNAYGTAPDTSPPEYHFQTYSKPTTEAAGEGLSNTEYTAQFSFISRHPDREQPRLQISVSPDMGEGGRMSYIGLADMEDGIAVTFFDTPVDENGKVGFAGYDLGTLTRDKVHTIKFWMKLNPGPDNDLVRIFIDDRDVGQCFTTWENFYRAASQAVPISDRLLFLSGNRDGNRLGLLGGGYLFDSVTTTTAAGPELADCPADGGGPPDIDVDKTTQTRVARSGDLITYRLTVTNRGDAPARTVRVCDRAPRALRFLRDRSRLRRAAGRRLCLTIPLLRPGESKTYRATFRLRAGVTADTVTNDASVDTTTGSASAPSPVPPDEAGIQPRRRRLDSDAAKIRVRGAQRRRPPPAVTG
jgi:uncharacterized repeat protein (TIGR01451 family)